MTLYTYRCRACGAHHLSTIRDDYLHSVCCDNYMQRVWGFSTVKSMEPHFNHSLGQPVSNTRQFDDGLKRKAEEQTARTGIEHNYVRIDPRDMAAAGATAEGIEQKLERTNSATYNLS